MGKVMQMKKNKVSHCGNAAKTMFTLLSASACCVALAAFDIGAAMDTAEFWKSDPVMFVKRHQEEGFRFTSSDRESADTRLDGAVTYHDIPVFESKIAFTEDGRGVARVELILFSPAGTEVRQPTDSSHYRLVRNEKTINRDEFVKLMKDVRAKLTPEGKKSPTQVAERTKKPIVQKSQTWPKTDIPTMTTLTWNYSQVGTKTDTFEAGFVRLAVDGPERLAGKTGSASARRKPASARKIVDNVVRDPRGDVFIDNVPMVDQGQKGYCAAATSERVLRYYGLQVDEHEVAQAAGTTAEGGTSLKEMKDSVAAIGKRYNLATVVSYGDFQKSDNDRIEGLVREVEGYNRAARKLKKEPIKEGVYMRRQGHNIMYDPRGLDAAMDPEVLKYMKTEGSQKSKYTKFLKDVHDQVNKGIPVFWGVTLGIYPEPEIPQSNGGHMRLIIGYNDKKKEILYTDTWGAGHELKRMPVEWAWTISKCLMYMKPLN